MTTSCLRPALALLVGFLAFGPNPSRAQDMVIYNDALQSPWADWGWAATRDPNNSSPVHSGTKSYAVTITNGWGAFSLWHGNFDSSPYDSITFWIHGGTTGGQQLRIYGDLDGAGKPPVDLPLPAANTWTQFAVSLAALGVANSPNFSRFSIQDRSGSPEPTFYLDDIRLTAAANIPPAVTLVSPADTAAYTAPANLTLLAAVVTNGHTINKVGFYSGSTLLAEDTTPPYTATWSATTPGNYSFFARVTYDSSSPHDSATANVTVGSGAITVDAQSNRHPISPLIYGVCFAKTASELAGMNCPIHRSGGNAETRYNWQLNAHNRAADWYFESIGDSPATPAAAADSFVSTSQSGGALPMLTIPMIGWLPKLGSNRDKLASYSITKYGPQTASDQWMPDAGNGISSTNNNKPITWNDPNDANFLTDSLFQQAFVQHLTNSWSLSTNGGVRYYLMDNEHSIWFGTHQDVHPTGPTMQEIRDKFFDYAGRVKAIDPNALVAAPEEWGWSGYLYSGYDQQWAGAHGDYNPAHYPDRVANGGRDYCPWLLSQFYQRATNTNQRLLDYFTLHCYPQGGESGNDVSTSTQLLRNRSTRQLWDTNYVDPTWVNNIIMLIPRMKAWVAAYYPGTKLGITEYNWGADSNISGATAQADILGIFGREGLDLATRWTSPSAGTPAYNAFKMYRNYDGNKSTFGDTSIGASGSNPDAVSVFAALRSSDNALTLMVINKQLDAAAAPTITLSNFIPTGTVQVWQLTSANTITRLSDLTLTGSTISPALPAQSITLYVVPGVAQAGPPATPSPANGATSVPVNPNPTLSWTPGANATTHRLYFGTSSNALATATTNSSEFKGALTSPSYGPGPLASSGRFYWRVDEMLGTAATPGPVWTFATVVVPTERLRATATLANTTNFIISFPSQVGQTYRVERTERLNPPSWVTVADNLPGTGAPIPITDSAQPGHPQRFYRVLTLAP